jgi:hypothetical protein
MLAFEPCVIIVDDKKSEIQGIIDYYQEASVGCKYYNANLTSGNEKPTKQFSDISLIYLDIHLSDNDRDYDPELCSGWIQSLIPEHSFYVLVIWSKEVEKATEILKELKKINRMPCFNLVVSKTEYTTTSGLDFNRLNVEIDRQISNFYGLEELALWRRNLKAASNVVIGHLAKSINPEDFTNRLKKIIVSHGGTSIKTNSDNYRKRTILFDALDSVLVSNTDKSKMDEAISQNNMDNLYNLLSIKEPLIDKELNSWFHFKLDKNIPSDLLCPGLIALNKQKLLKQLYSIQDDPKIEKLFAKQLHESVIIEDIVLVINRPCDLAQNKFGKNLKLLSGVLLKSAYRYPSGKHKDEIHFNDITVPDSIKIYEHLFFTERENDITLIFDFRYIFSIPVKIFTDKFEKIKIFNKELLSEIQVEYSSYSSRLGITQII